MVLFKKQNKGNGLPHFLGAKKENKRFFERGFAGDFVKKVRKENPFCSPFFSAQRFSLALCYRSALLSLKRALMPTITPRVRKSGRNIGGNDRYRMFPSFEKDHQIIGASEATISAWLGVADSTREETNSQGFSWIYDLGPDGLGIDNYLLCITFSHEKIATSYSVYDS